MSHIINNWEALAQNRVRRDALDIVESALVSIDTETVLRQNLSVRDGVLSIQGKEYPLTEYEHIYIIGFGKVSCKAAYVLEEMLEGKVRDGAVVGIREVTCKIVETYAGTHPLPSHINFTATKHIEEIAQKAKENDLVLVVVSGGGSALLCSSVGECDQGQRLYDAFLRSGGTIEELNVVRKHISHLKGGGLAKALYPATVIGLVFSDVPGGDIASIASGPTCMDNTAIEDAQAIIERYDLGTYHLTETPEDPRYFEKVHNVLVASNLTALKAMEYAANMRGYKASVVSATQYASPEETKEMFFAASSENQVLCMGGETKLVVPKGAHGKGGRNTHLALTMLDILERDQVFVSFASDGKDNTDAAGALADRAVLEKALALGIRPETYVEACDSYAFFKETQGLLFMPQLESNVADLMLLLSPVS